jgi:hypothetical protein
MLRKNWKPLMALFIGLVVPIMNVPSALADSWTFTVTNSGRSKILRIEAAESGTNNWGPFTTSAINPGQTVTLEWDSSTDNSSCNWKVRAIYADGPSESSAFDFCKSTEIEFDN